MPGAVGVHLGFLTVQYEQLHLQKDAPHLLSVLVLSIHFVPDSLRLPLHSHPISCSGDVNLRFLAGLSGVMLAIALRTDVGTLKQLELEPKLATRQKK